MPWFLCPHCWNETYSRRFYNTIKGNGWMRCSKCGKRFPADIYKTVHLVSKHVSRFL